MRLATLRTPTGTAAVRIDEYASGSHPFVSAYLTTVKLKLQKRTVTRRRTSAGSRCRTAAKARCSAAEHRGHRPSIERVESPR